jgi:hypothetical protein
MAPPRSRPRRLSRELGCRNAPLGSVELDRKIQETVQDARDALPEFLQSFAVD